jgi:hypothetical protein
MMDSPHPQPLSHLTLPSPPHPALSYKERGKEVPFYWRGKRKFLFTGEGRIDPSI